MHTPKPTRRLFIGALVAGSATGLLLAGTQPESTAFAQNVNQVADWAQVPIILARIKPPSFPGRDFVVTDYGARGDGATNSRRAINNAIRACAKAGGGRVIIPRGSYISNGALRLLSNVNLHLEAGATLRFGINPEDYLPRVLVRWEGTRFRLSEKSS